MSWLRVIIDTGREQSPVVEQALEHCGAVSVSFEDRADEPVFELRPGDTPLWSETRITGLFPADADTSHIIDQVTAALGHVPLHTQIEKLADQNWERVWLERFQPTRVGKRLWICPTHMDPPDPQAVTVFIDPGLAFGSGTHPTTAMCLQWLADQDLQDKLVIDYGCGSGILAIAALKLGARRAIGVDIDPRALEVSLQNAEINKVSERLLTCLPDSIPQGVQADILVANILSGPLTQLSAVISQLVAKHGKIALSGILQAQSEEVRDAYAREFSLQASFRDGWTLLFGARV
jgi:ribosomal protein L11 methyltransferase